MRLIVLIGAQAVGKMTVGRELEKKIDGRLLYNHQTIDPFAYFLGYEPATFALSERMRLDLFQAFVDNEETNLTKSLIFTVLVNFDNAADVAFLHKITRIFQEKGQAVYFAELMADLDVRLVRNSQPERLAAKPSKRDLSFSEKELLTAHEKMRLVSKEGEIVQLFPQVAYCRVNNSLLSPEQAAITIIEQFSLT